MEKLDRKRFLSPFPVNSFYNRRKESDDGGEMLCGTPLRKT